MTLRIDIHLTGEPFERHGIDHLSPPSLNLWAAERLLGRRSHAGAAGRVINPVFKKTAHGSSLYHRR